MTNEQSDAPVRLAVIGAGFIGRRHIDTIAEIPEARLVAVADPAPAAEALAEKNRAAYFRDYETLLEKIAPDGVVIATPTEQHLSPALAALDAGAHVLIEKPVTATVEEARQLISKTDESGRHTLVGHHRRYYPLVDKTRALVRGGALGRLVGVNAQWTTLKHEEYFAPDWRRRRESGPVMINLVHEIDCLRYICGEISALSARISNDVRQFAKEDSAAIIIELLDGGLATVLLSDGTPSPWTWEFATGENPAFPPTRQNVWRFCGTEAALEFPNLLLWRQREGERGWQFTQQAEPLLSELGDAFVHQCKHFCAVIRGQEEPRISARDAARTLEATVAVFTAAASGARVELPA